MFLNDLVEKVFFYVLEELANFCGLSFCDYNWRIINRTHQQNSLRRLLRGVNNYIWIWEMKFPIRTTLFIAVQMKWLCRCLFRGRYDASKSCPTYLHFFLFPPIANVPVSSQRVPLGLFTEKFIYWQFVHQSGTNYPYQVVTYTCSEQKLNQQVAQKNS